MKLSMPVSKRKFESIISKDFHYKKKEKYEKNGEMKTEYLLIMPYESSHPEDASFDYKITPDNQYVIMGEGYISERNIFSNDEKEEIIEIKEYNKNSKIRTEQYFGNRWDNEEGFLKDLNELKNDLIDKIDIEKTLRKIYVLTDMECLYDYQDIGIIDNFILKETTNIVNVLNNEINKMEDLLGLEKSKIFDISTIQTSDKLEVEEIKKGKKITLNF